MLFTNRFDDCANSYMGRKKRNKKYIAVRRHRENACACISNSVACPRIYPLEIVADDVKASS